MPLTCEKIENYIVPLSNRYWYFLKRGFQKIISWRNVYFGCVCSDGLEAPSLSVVIHPRCRDPRAMLGALLPPPYRRGLAGKRGAGC